MPSSTPPLLLLADAIRAARTGQLLVVTGAGVSLASGIPTFRGKDPGAVWAKDVTELATFDFFRRDPAGSWSWYLTRFSTLEGKLPNAGHRALVELERWQKARGGDFLLVTQNIDCLHEQAGSSQMIKVHGSSDRVRCSSDGCVLGAPAGSLPIADVDLTKFRADPIDANVPRCPKCGDYLRMHILWFDERYDDHRDFQIERVIEASQAAAVTVFAGTSFSVGLTDLVLQAGLRRDSKLFSIDPSGQVPNSKVVPIRTGSEDTFPQLVSLLADQLR